MVHPAIIDNIVKGYWIKLVLFLLALILIDVGQQYSVPLLNSSLDALETTSCVLRSCMCFLPL